MTLSRRQFLHSVALSAAAGTLSHRAQANLQAVPNPKVPVGQITHGPKHHWFGYYDKLQFDPTNRYVLSMEVDSNTDLRRPMTSSKSV